MTDHQGGLARWEKLSSERLADFRIFRVNRSQWKHSARPTPGEFFVLETSNWVLVVAVTTAGELIMVRQFRFGMEQFSLEVPGGVMEAGEDPLIAARRELAEETGYVGGEARLIGAVRPNPAIQANTCHIVMIDGVTASGTQAFDEHEDIEVEKVPVARALELAHAGAIAHALAINALFFLEPHWRARGQPGV